MGKENQFDLELTKKEKENFKEALRKRREELPLVLKTLLQHEVLIEIILKEPDEMLNNLPLHDTIQFHSVNAPEITSSIMIEPCIEVNDAILKQAKKNRLSEAQKSVLLAQKERLKSLKKDSKNGETIVHSFTEIVDNLQVIDKSCTRKLLLAIQKVNKEAIHNTKVAIENYNRLTL